MKSFQHVSPLLLKYKLDHVVVDITLLLPLLRIDWYQE